MAGTRPVRWARRRVRSTASVSAEVAMALTNRVLTALGSVLILAVGLWWSAGHLLLAPFGLSALAGAALLGGLTICLASGARLVAITAAIPQLSHALALRDKSWGAAFLRQ